MSSAEPGVSEESGPVGALGQHEAQCGVYRQLIEQFQTTIRQQQQTIQQLREGQDPTSLPSHLARHQHLQQQVQQLQQLVAEQQQQLQRQAEQQQQMRQHMQHQLDTMQQQLQLLRQPDSQPATAEQKTRDINFIGSAVRRMTVFEEASTCFGLAVSGGRLYVADHEFAVVDVVDGSSGARLTRYGTFNQQGKAVVGQPPRFQSPYGVAVNQRRGVLYVLDRSLHCVVVVRLSDGLVEAVWGSEGSDQQQFYFPASLAYCAATDKLYVADGQNHLVKVLRTFDGKCVELLGVLKGLSYPGGVAVDSHQIYIADTGNDRVLVLAKKSRELQFEIGTGEKSDNIELSVPCSVSVDGEAGLLYVADSCNHRVCVYRSSDGSYIRQFPVLDEDNSPIRPMSVMWDAVSGLLYVTPLDSTTIYVY
eukprot:TRINITY_DN2655_c0_g3_i1.p1 TRINITY_DN2655_c0_g3~~TRINITY_DN2655_c0_g3_i1.p1  ORF type:complete len:420 (-),score=107.47 TRINITY_DN2655_c0_g3_i1:61-1320(-)